MFDFIFSTLPSDISIYERVFYFWACIWFIGFGFGFIFAVLVKFFLIVEK